MRAIMFKFSNFKYIVCVLVAIVFVSLAMDRPPQGGGWWQSTKNFAYNIAGRINLIAPRKRLITLLNEYNEKGQRQETITALVSLLRQYPQLMQEAIYNNVPLLLSFAFAQLQVFKPLVEQLFNSENVDLRIDSGLTALMLASYNGNTSLIKILLDRGANPDLQGDQGDTALMILLQYYPEPLPIVRLLLDAGANTSLRNNKGQTAFDLAANNPPALALLNEYKKKKID
jgi:hypothetical protein